MEYEQFLGRSFYTTQVIHLVDRFRQSISQLSSGQPTEAAIDVFSNWMSSEEAQKIYDNFENLTMTMDVRQIIQKNSYLGGKIGELKKISEDNKHLSDFTHDRFDPIPSIIMRNDHLLAYFKCGRKSNFKNGIAKNYMGIFDNKEKLSELFQVYLVNNAFICEQIEKRDQQALEAKIASLGGKLSIEKTLQMIAMKLLMIKKEDRPGPEVATDILQSICPLTEKINDLVKSTLEETFNQKSVD